MRGHIIIAMAAMAATMPAAAHAEGETAAVEVSYNVALVSDYRFRGLSLTNRDPAVQGGIDAAFGSGFFVGTWASNIADYGGSNLEVDLYGGYGGSIGGFDYTASVLGYLYPGGDSVNYVELQSTVARTIGPVTTTLTLAYTPDQWNTTRDNFYAGIGADVAIIGTPLTASLALGRENGGYDEKWDWSAGLSYKFDVLEISASYVDSNYKGALEAGHNGGAGAIVSVKAAF
ncbi:TorF family putative porin [Sphingomonas sp. SRS2]|uniref:TorF family putative porin n=1 Tax=Sphingomonas sp. SRS2 TaxID=133190 RepID=UPI000618447A|nr:TorF family putative porin [Sphingomonas sp. SRS2]KKC26584.1 hypothetical protein WP12_07860 [Sphingomonas sp. SRS2]